MTRASRSRMPASPSPCARKARFASWVRPDRISFPMIRTQAVTILGAVSLLGIISSISLSRGLHRQLPAPAQSPPSPEDCRGPTACLPASGGAETSAVIARLPLSDYQRKLRPSAEQDVKMGLAPSETRDGRIKIHGVEAFEGMRRAGMLAAETLDFITPHVRPGTTTGELDRLCHGFIVDHDAIPAPLNYRGFPKSICTSINHVVCHGIPGDRRLMDGDILNIDVTVILDGWHGDTSRMFFVGERIPVKA